MGLDDPRNGQNVHLAPRARLPTPYETEQMVLAWSYARIALMLVNGSTVCGRSDLLYRPYEFRFSMDHLKPNIISGIEIRTSRTHRLDTPKANTILLKQPCALVVGKCFHGSVHVLYLNSVDGSEMTTFVSRIASRSITRSCIATSPRKRKHSPQGGCR